MHETLTPAEIGTIAHDVAQSGTFFTLIDGAPQLSGCTATQGACLPFALALLTRIPNATLYVLSSTTHPAEHFAVRVGNDFFDGDGHRTQDAMLAHWAAELRMLGRDLTALRPAVASDLQATESPDPVHPVTGNLVSRDLAALLALNGL